MKYIYLLLLLITIIPGMSQVEIKGKILNYDGETPLSINHAREGIHPYFSESAKVQPKKNGEFRYRFENDGMGVMKVHFRRINYTFLHEANSEIYFEIDQDKINYGPAATETFELMLDSVRQASTVVIEGSFKSYNQFLNKQPRTAYITTRSVSGNPYSLMLANETDPEKFVELYDSLKNWELNSIRNIINTDPEVGTTDMAGIRSFMEMEVNTFYDNIVLNALFLKRIRQVAALKNNPDTTLTIYNRGWENLAEKVFVNFAKQPQYANSFSYNEQVQSVNYSVLSYNEYEHTPNLYSWDEIIVKGLLQPEMPADSVVRLEDDVLYAFQITNLRHYVNSQQFYSPVLKQAIDSMESWHPGSAFLDALEPYFSKVDDYIRETKSSYTNAEVIEENYTTLEGLLQKFRGSTVLIDVWATWCHPCIGEFAFKHNLDDLIRSGELTMLYISIDKERWEKRWRENMNYNKLEGYHILADEVLIMDMWDALGDPVGAIPRYALVDPDGNIVYANAARPSQGEHLRNQILEVIGE